MTFRKRLLLLFLVLTLVPFVVLQVNTQLFYIPTITARVKALFTYNLQQKRENLRRLLVERVGLVSQISYDQGLADLVAELNRTPDPTSYLRSRMLDIFSRFTLTSDLMAGMGFIRNDGLVVGYERFGQGPSATDFSRYGSVQEVVRQVSETGSLVTFPTQTFPAVGKPRTVILSAFPYYELSTNSREGFYYLLLNEAAFQTVLNPTLDDGSGIRAQSLIYDGGRLVSFPDPTVFAGQDRPIFDPRDPSKLARRLPEFRGAVGLLSLDIPKTSWTVATLYDEGSLFSDRDAMLTYTLLVGAVFFLSSLVILWLGSRDLLKSFGALVEQVRVVGNRLDVGAGQPAGDELALLGNAFRTMQDRINTLVTEVNDRNAAMLTLAEEQRLAEIRALEAQVNPHFLYNTLNTLNWIAIRQGQTILSQGLSNLADIMRYSISQIEVTARLEEEVTWLRKYLDLQQLRFRHNFTYTIENRDVSPAFRIYKLLFQPLVENALVHGFDPNVSGGVLDIRFERNDQGYLVATISDNGRGLGAEIADGPGAIGLTNLVQRLAVYYPGKGTLVVEPRTEGGTRAVLTVPEAAA